MVKILLFLLRYVIMLIPCMIIKKEDIIMYCKNCGRFIGTDADLCIDGKSKNEQINVNTQNQFTNPYQNPYQNTNQNTYQNPYQIPYQNTYQNTSQNTVYTQKPSAVQDTSVINLGKAIAAMVLSSVGMIFIYAGVFSFDPAAAIICLILGLVPSILGLIFGIQSISNFKQTSAIKSGKRIPVLILGIASVVNAGIDLLLAFLLLILVGSV